MNGANKRTIISIILLGLALMYFKIIPSPFSFVNSESDFSPLQGAEFRTSNLPVQFWNLKSGCYNFAGTPQPEFGTPSSGCFGNSMGSDWTVDTKQNKLTAVSVGRSPVLGGEIEYKGNIIGKDLFFSGEAETPGTAILIHYANCDTLPGSSPGIGWGKNPGQFHADLLNTAFGSVKILSSRIDPSKAQVFLNGNKVCDADHNLEPAPFKNKFTIAFMDTGLRGGPAVLGPQGGGRVTINPVLERIPFSCNINKGIGEVLVTENFVSGTAFDKFSLSYPPAKFCNNIGAFLYDPKRGFDEDSEVYTQLNNGKSLTLPFDVKVAYIVRNIDPFTNKPYFQDPNCNDGFGIDAKTLTCKPLGGFVDLCRQGSLDVNRGACITKDTTICKGIVIHDASGVTICEAFLPNLNQLCAPGTIVLNGSNAGTCVAPKISCGANHDLIQISLSEYSCVSKIGTESVPTTQEKVSHVQETDIITPSESPIQQIKIQPVKMEVPTVQTSMQEDSSNTIIIGALVLLGLFLWRFRK